MFILETLFAPQLSESLNKSFAEHNFNWTTWTTSFEEYTDEDGQEKTKLKGCFNITKIHDNSTLIASIPEPKKLTHFQLMSTIREYGFQPMQPLKRYAWHLTVVIRLPGCIRNK